jgi:hypothetical protein
LNNTFFIWFLHKWQCNAKKIDISERRTQTDTDTDFVNGTASIAMIIQGVSKRALQL